MDTCLTDQIAVARAAIDRVLSSLTTAEISGSTVKELHALLDRVDLGTTFAYNRFQKSGDHLLDGYANGPAWLAANTRALRHEVHARKDHAELLDLLGSFGDSFHHDRIGYAHIRILAPAVTEQRRSLAVRDEHVLLEAAEALTPSEFKMAVRKWVSLCDDELSDPTRPDNHAARRRVTLTVLPDGSWKLDGILEPLAGETLAAALTAVMPSKPLPDDDRTIVQKRHDAPTTTASNSPWPPTKSPSSSTGPTASSSTAHQHHNSPSPGKQPGHVRDPNSRSWSRPSAHIDPVSAQS